MLIKCFLYIFVYYDYYYCSYMYCIYVYGYIICVLQSTIIHCKCRYYLVIKMTMRLRKKPLYNAVYMLISIKKKPFFFQKGNRINRNNDEEHF